VNLLADYFSKPGAEYSGEREQPDQRIKTGAGGHA